MKFVRIFLLLTLITAAQALTVSPAEHLVNYHTGSERYDLTIHNDEQRAVDVTLSATGPLSQLLSFPLSVHLEPQASATVPITFTLPESTQPGVLESGILIESRAQGSDISAASAVLHKVQLTTPSQGAYLAGAILHSAGIAGGQQVLTLSLQNTGTEPLDISGTLRIADQQLSVSIAALAPQATKDVYLSWTPASIGSYTAIADLTYNAKHLSLSEPLVVGNLSVVLLGISAGDFRLGDPFKLSVFSQNEWGDSLPVQMSVSVQQSNKTAVTATTQAEQAPGVQSNTPFFLESSSLVPGRAIVFVKATYAGKIVTASYPAVISVDQFAIGKPETASSTTLIVGIIIGLALIATVIIFIKRRRSR